MAVFPRDMCVPPSVRGIFVAVFSRDMCVPPSARGNFVAVICAFPLAHVVYFVAVFSTDMCDPPSKCMWYSFSLA